MKTWILLLLLLPAVSKATPVSTTHSVLTAYVSADDEYEKYRKEGDELFKKGDYEKATKKFRACLEVPGFSNDTYATGRIRQCDSALKLRQQAQTALVQGQGAQAVEFFKQLLVINANDPLTRQQLADYWTREGNQRYEKGDFAEARSRYEEALRFADKPDLLTIQIKNCNDRLAALTPAKPAVTSSETVVSSPVVIQKPPVAVPSVSPSAKRGGSGLKLVTGAIGLGAGAFAFILNSQYKSKLADLAAVASTADADGDNVIPNQVLYTQWKTAYDDTKAAQSNSGLFKACVGVAVGAAILETYLFLKKPATNRPVTIRPAAATTGVAIHYTF